MKEKKKEKLIPELRFKEFKEEWVKSSTKEITTHIKDGTHGTHKDSVNGEYLLLSAKNIQNGTITWDSEDRQISKTTYDQITKSYLPKKNDILLSIVGTIGRVAIWNNQKDIAFQRSVAFFRFDKQDSFFFQNLMNTSSYQNELLRRQVVSAQPGIYLGELADIRMTFPSLPEQQKISSFLSLIDKKIELLNKKKELLEIYKKGIMHNIFNRDIRFKDSNGNDYPEWEEKKLGEIFKERAERGNIDLELLSVTQDRGVIKRTEIDAVDNSNDNKGIYKKVNIGDIAYNSMRMWQGASGLSPYQGIVSPAYTVIYTDENTHFYSYMFKWPRVVYNFRRYSQGLTSDTWNLKYPLFSEVSVYRPQLEEQTKIATFLPRLDKLLFNIVKQIDTVSQFKRGLLQKMFV